MTSHRRNRRLEIVASLFAALAVLSTAGCFGGSDAVAGEGEGEDETGEEESEVEYAFQDYDEKVESLRDLPAAPELEVDDAPVVDSTVERSESEWREQLTDEEFRILRENGTERAGTGEYAKHYETGVYRCAGCGAPLFSSRHKFDSDTGWPSYTQPYEPGRVDYSKDGGLFSYRVEVHCARCGGHLGHVFADGPDPTGKRYCINSAALDFEAVETE